MTAPITYVRNAIHNPDEPRHFMVMKSLPHEVVATSGGRRLARSHGALRVHEAGYDLYDPVVYFPREDVDMSLLQRSDKTTHCPLKGDTEYFDLVVGDRRIENVAWSFRDVLTFDARLEDLRDRIAFDAKRLQVTEFTEGAGG